MAAFNFPDSPSNGDLFTGSGKVYQYNSTKGYWVVINYDSPVGFTGSKGDTGAQGTGSADTSPTPPTGIADGHLWYDTDDATLSVYYDDGNTSQWVVTSGILGPRGYTGSQGVVGFTGSQGTLGYTGSIGRVTSAASAPTGSDGDLWFNTNDSSLNFYYGAQANWVAVSGPRGYTGSQGIQGVIGYTGSIGYSGSRGYTGSQGEVSVANGIIAALVFG